MKDQRLKTRTSVDPYLRNILAFNEQLSPRGLRTENFRRLAGVRYDAIAICGMGGSGLGGEVVRAAQGELGITAPIFIWKDYGLPALPAHVKRPLFLFVSFSGNTEETLSGLAALRLSRAAKSTAQAAVVATGGALSRIAKEKGIPAVRFDSGDLTPRQGTGKMVYAIIEILLAARLIRRRPPIFTRLKPLSWKQKGYALARRLRRKIIVIYTAGQDRHLGYLWKIKFNETSKTPAFLNVLPEMNHNELVGLSRMRFPVAALFLERGRGERLAKRMAITMRLLERRRVKSIAIPVTGKSKLEQAWNTIMFADWTSYALAKMNSVDPRKTEIIDTLKAELKR